MAGKGQHLLRPCDARGFLFIAKKNAMISSFDTCAELFVCYYTYFYNTILVVESRTVRQSDSCDFLLPGMKSCL